MRGESEHESHRRGAVSGQSGHAESGAATSAPASSFPGVGPFPYADALEWRFVTGSFEELGPATVWTRCRIPVLRGVALTGLQRVLVMVDAANGISASLLATESRSHGEHLSS
jgi:hypothetical protein